MSNLTESPRLSAIGLRWYVAYTQRFAETTAAAHLTHQGFKPFLPLCHKSVRHARKFRRVVAPFFPRYLFVALAIDRDRWRSVNGTVGVSYLIMEGDYPKPVPAGVVERLIAAADSSGMIGVGPDLQPGQKVRLVSGPFAGFVGDLASLDADGRVRVLLELMGSTIPVTANGMGIVSAA